jgi:hypothetical protein
MLVRHNRGVFYWFRLRRQLSGRPIGSLSACARAAVEPLD